ncbi:hypothetical protein ACQ4PT_038227 [Festuca glaucescens]
MSGEGDPGDPGGRPSTAGVEALRHRRRRLTLAPAVENRFSLLRAVPEEDEAAGTECTVDHVALHVAEEVLVDYPARPSSPVIRRPWRSEGDLLAEFWADAGYPSPSSRVWERRSSLGSSTAGMANQGSSVCRSSSSSPIMARRAARRGGRSASASPTGLCLSRPPRVGSWRGPLPPRRVTPRPILGFFLDEAVAAMPSSTSPAEPAVSVSEKTSRASADRAGLHAEVGPAAENVDSDVPAGWTHLRRRRRRVSPVTCNQHSSSLQPPAPLSPSRLASSPGSVAPSSSPAAWQPSLRPSLPLPWLTSRRTFLSAVMQPTGGVHRPAGPAPPGPAAGAAARGGVAGAAPRPAGARPAPPFPQPPGGAAAGMQLQNQQTTSGSAAQGLLLQQQQGHGQQLFVPQMPQYRPTAALPLRPLQPPSRQPGPPAYMPQVAPPFFQQQSFVPAGFQQQQQQFPLSPSGQYQQPFVPPPSAVAGQVQSRNKRKKKKGGQPGQIGQQSQPQQSDQFLQPQFVLPVGGTGGTVETVSSLPEVSVGLDAPVVSVPVVLPDEAQDGAWRRRDGGGVWGCYIALAPHHRGFDADYGRDGLGSGCFSGTVSHGPPSYFYRDTYYTNGVTVAGSVTFPAIYAYDPDDTLCDAFAAT